MTETIVTQEPLEEVRVVQANFLETGLVEVEMSSGMKKVITAKDFYSSLGSCMEEQASVASVILPSGTYAIAQHANQIDLGMYFPSTIRELIYTYWNSPRKIRTPNLMISIKLKETGNNYRVTDVRYLSTRLEYAQLPPDIPFSPNHTSIFLSPFSNTYDEANMCYGGNAMPMQVSKTNLRALNWYHEFLWATPFNDDLGIKAIANSMSVRDWYHRLHRCAEEDQPFPYDMLRN